MTMKEKWRQIQGEGERKTRRRGLFKRRSHHHRNRLRRRYRRKYQYARRRLFLWTFHRRNRRLPPISEQDSPKPPTTLEQIHLSSLLPLPPTPSILSPLIRTSNSTQLVSLSLSLRSIWEFLMVRDLNVN
ncbi:hypothetical protein PanWU01x14_123770 [Parasponia andersonii]|uniref:Uncharacterized protein n=1 Tax=Parasponia andersonii TaxID=3476 RepID=A0A2P5CTY5_PARAD|nr:hypothetical protein PanWU01x14_123770 [Parasponia andersonii]